MTHVALSRVHPHPLNVRADLGDLSELVASIRAQGILQPLVVQPHPARHGEFVLIAGHRRYAAAKLAKLGRVPITVREAAGPAKAIEAMLVENLQRADLTPMDKAEAMGSLRDHGYSNVAIGRAIGLADGTVSTYLSLLELSKASREKVRSGELTMSDAVAAVRRTRERTRKATGQRSRGEAAALSWEPDHFTPSHPLARRAQALCQAREHNNRRRIGKTACGQCWETVIRVDERTAATVLEAAS